MFEDDDTSPGLTPPPSPASPDPLELRIVAANRVRDAARELREISAVFIRRAEALERFADQIVVAAFQHRRTPL